MEDSGDTGGVSLLGDRNRTASSWLNSLLTYGLPGSVLVLVIVSMTPQDGVLMYSAISLSGLFLSLTLSVSLRQGRHIQIAVIAAFLIRVSLLVLLILRAWYSGHSAHYLRAGDATKYHEWACYVVETADWRLWGALPTYTYIVASLYRMFGPDPNIIDLVNMCLGLMLVPLVSELGRRCGGRRAGIASAWLVALYPSLILWSISGVKDVWLVLGTVLTAYMTTSLASGQCRISDTVKFSIGAPLLVYLRFQFLLSLLLAVGATMFVRGSRSRRPRPVLILVFAVLGSLTLLSPLGRSALANVVRLQEEEAWQAAQSQALTGASGIPALAGIPAKARWIAQFPFVVLAPFPWQWPTISSGINRLVALEMMIHYVLMSMLVLRRHVWRDDATANALISYAAAIALAVSFSLPNLGSIHRYRVSAAVMILPVAAQALAMYRTRRPTGKSDG